MNILSDIASGRFMQLPAPIQMGLGMVAGTATLGATWFAVGSSPSRNMAMIIVAIGLACVFALFMLFRLIVKWRAKRKANPLAMGIAGNAAAAPQGVSEPARRARLDDLRRNFEQGVEKFRAAGKNLYSVPWYVLVGEPGSGKTEAIRHCNVGFPPGLQDQLQGAGGTLNMNWWFTNSAIILDTAGRLMFEEITPGTTNEWNEFLKLLKNNRPNCPINGMLLVIPVDTLVKDSADAIEKKATKIAQQFDQIQRILGVRFPVFVIITKCDLLNGFREFFDDLNDPQLQHQIMGWSNPSPLDEKFDPAKVTAHLEAVRLRLASRRQNLLLDPVHSEDPQARRVDQVDALYALPDAITKIGPRLRRYLEMIFVAGEWSPMPLFLRGIYFTSSMTEGAALDAELAEALGVPVDSLPGGAIFRKDRAYFLRDLFLEKVFREKGLVTRASNADKQQRTRRTLVLGFGFLAVLVLFAITFFGSRSLDRSLGAERLFWEEASGWDFSTIAIIKKRDNSYFGEPSMTVGGSVTSIPDLFSNNLDRVKRDLAIPIIFKPMKIVTGDVNDARRAAYRQLFESTVLRPVYGMARSKIPGDTWDPKKGPPALAEFMKLEYAVATLKPPAGTHPQVELAPLFALALSDEDYTKYIKDRDNLQKVADWVYTAEAGGASEWPPKILNAGTPASRDTIKAGVDATIAYWNQQAKDDSQTLASINQARAALLQFREAEKALLDLRRVPIDKMSLYVEFRARWQSEFDKLRKARDAASGAWAAASGGKEDATLTRLYTAKKDAVFNDAGKSYDILLKYAPEAPANVPAAMLGDSYNTLLEARAKLLAAQKNLTDWKTSPVAAAMLKELADLDAAYIGGIQDTDSTQRRRFEVQARLYETADKFIVREGEVVQVSVSTALSDAFAAIDKSASEIIDGANRLQIRATGEDGLSQAIALTRFSTEASARARKFLMADGIVAGYPRDAAGWNAAVTRLAKEAPRENLVRPQVPLVSFPAGFERTFNDQFSPDAAGTVSERFDTITKVATDKDAALKILDAADLKSRADASRKGFDGYRETYIRYWRETVKEELTFNYTQFNELSAKLSDTTEANIFEQLKAYGDRMYYALNRIGAADEANAVKLAPGISREECKQALTSWTNFPADAVQVRRAVLGMVANDFKEKYLVVSAKASDSHAAYYWSNFPVASLRALVAEGQKQIRDGIAELAKYERFPLDTFDEKEKDLTQDEVLAARKALEKVRGAAASVAAAPPAGGAVSVGARAISQGGLTNNKDIDAQLELLRGTNLLRDKQEYFDKLDKFMAGMPQDAQPLTLTLTVNKAKLTDVTNSISNAYSYMPISQAGKLLRESNLISTNVTDSATVEYAGGDLTLGFRQTPGGQILKTETFPGPWGILRLMRSPAVKSYTRDGNKWSIEYTVTTAENKAVALWLNLEFKQPVPDVKDWPVPPRTSP